VGDVHFRQLELLLSAGPGLGWGVSWFRILGGPELGLIVARQDRLPGGEYRWGVQPFVAARAAVDARLGAGWVIRLTGLGGVGYARTQTGSLVHPLVRGALMVVYEW
jgi:hypothetical protein